MRVLTSNGMSWAWPRVEANASTISTENTSKINNMSVHEESRNLSTKFIKKASIFYDPKKNHCKYLAPWASHVHKTVGKSHYST